KIAVLFEGFPTSTQQLLESIKQNFTFVTINVKQDELNDYPLFIIPAGGLQGLSNSLNFREKIKKYVEQGGNILVFSQQHGYEYGVLPYNVDGFGWLEDQSCQFSSVYLETYHPMLASISKKNPDVNVDGYFTEWPENSTILLRRVKNSMPVLIRYSVGRGNVIAYTAYSDWVFGRGASQEEIKFVRDIVIWGKDSSREIVEINQNDAIDVSLNLTITPAIPLTSKRFSPGQEVNLNINVTNDANEKITKIGFELYDPEYNIFYINMTKDIGKNTTAEIPFTYTTGLTSSQGGWYVLYNLYNSTGGVVSYGFGGGFIISNVTNMSTTYYAHFTLRDPDGDIISTETIEINVSEDITALDYNYPSANKLGLWQLDYVIYDNNNSKSGIVDYGGKFFAVSLFKQNPNMFYYQSNDISFDVNSDSETYFYGSNGNFEIRIWNKGSEDKDITVWYSFPHNYWAKHDDIYGRPGTTSPGFISNLHNTTVVPAGGSQIISYSVPIYSYDRLWADFYYGNETSRSFIGKATRGVYAVPAAMEISIDPDKEEYLKGEKINALVSLKNTLSSKQDASIHIRLIDPNNVDVYSEIRNVTILGYSSINESIETNELNNSGTYTLLIESYTLPDATGQKSGSGNKFLKVPKDYLMVLKFNRSNGIYKSGEIMSYDLEITNVAEKEFTTNISVDMPSLSPSKKEYNNQYFAAGEKKVFSVTGLKVPDDIKAGQHTGSIKLSLDNSVKQIGITVPNSKLSAYMLKKNYNASGNISILIENVGGVATSYEARQNSWYFRDIVSGQNGTLKPGEVGEAKLSISPLYSGKYSIGMYYTDKNIGLTNSFYDNVEIQGITVYLSPSKKNYQVGENLTISARNPSGIDVPCDIYASYSYYPNSVNKVIPTGSTTEITLSEIPASIQTGSYRLYMSCQNTAHGRSYYYYDNINITGIDVNLSIEKKDYHAGDNYTIVVKNIGPVDITCSYISSHISGNSVWSSSYYSNQDLSVGETKSYSFKISETTNTGDYSVYSECYETSSRRYFGQMFSVSIVGFDTKIELIENNIDAGENLEIQFNNKGGLDAKLDCNIFLDLGFLFKNNSILVSEGQSLLISGKIAKSKTHGNHEVLVSCYDSISQNSFSLTENITLLGYNVTLGSNEIDIDAFTNFSYTIENKGFRAALNCSYLLNSTNLGSDSFIVDKNENFVANVLIPRDTDSGVYEMNITCKEDEADKESKLSKLIVVKGLELEFDLAKQSVTTNEDLPITIFNKGGVDADCEVKTFIGLNEDVEELYISKDGYVGYNYKIPVGLNGPYVLNISCFEKETNKRIDDSKNIEVTGFNFEVLTDSNEYIAGTPIDINISVSGSVDANYKYTNLIRNEVYESLDTDNVLILSNEGYTYSVNLNNYLESGIYRLIVGCEDTDTNKINNVSVLLNITGLDLIMETDKEEYVAGDAINVELSNVGAIDADGQHSVYLTKDDYVIDSSSAALSVDIGDTENVVFNINLDTDSATYLLVSSFSDDDTGRVINNTKQIVIKGMELDIQSLSQKEGVLVQPLILELKNIGALVMNNLNCNIKLKDKDSIPAYNGANATTLVLNQTKELSYELPNTLVSGRYSANVDCTDSTIGKSVKKTFSLTIDDFSGDFGLKLSKDMFLTEENIRPFLEAEFNGTLTTMSNANVNLSVYSVTENNQSEEWSYYNASNGLCGDSVQAAASYSSEAWFLVWDNDNFVTNLCKYSSDSDVWEQYDITGLVIQGGSMAVDSSYLWIGSGNRLYRYGKSSGVWDIFNSTNTNGIINETGQISSIVLNDNDVWILLTIWGAGDGIMGEGEAAINQENFGGIPLVYDQNEDSWSIYDLNLIGIDADTVKFVGFDNDVRWFGFENGVASYDTNNRVLTKYTAAESELLAESLGSIAITDKGVWFNYQWNSNGLVRFDKNSGSWVLVTSEDGGLLWDGINSISAKNDKLWVAYMGDYSQEQQPLGEQIHETPLPTFYGVSVFDESLDSWSNYNTSNSEIVSDQIQNIIIGDNIWFVPGFESSGVSRLSEGKGVSYDLILSKTLTVDISEPGVDISNFSIDSIGLFEARANVYSGDQQYVSSALAQFNIVQKNISANMSTDKDVYKPSEPIGIEILITNNAKIDAEGIDVKVYEDIVIFRQAKVNVGPHDTYVYNTNHTSNSSFLLNVLVDNIWINKSVKIENPVISAGAFAPDVGGSAEFIVGVSINNTGNVTADLTVNIDNSSENVSIAANSSVTITKEMSINKNTTVLFEINGDSGLNFTRDIIYGEAAIFNITQSTFTSSGLVEIPFEFENTGKLDLHFNATFNIAGNKVIKEIYLPFNQSVMDSVLFNLGDGAHELRYSSILGEGVFSIAVGTADFEVIKFAQNISYTLGANVSLNCTTKNVGGLFGKTTVKFSMPGIFEDGKEIYLESGKEETSNFEFVLPDDLEERRYKIICEANQSKVES
ncbi:MAG: hypothetical protein ABIJ08_01865, partial [Nanoarchaeota archaeon]